MSKYFKHNLSTTLSVFNDDIKADQFNADKNRLNIWFPKQQINLYFSVFKNNCEAINGTKLTAVKINHTAHYYVNSKGLEKVNNQYFIGADLVKLLVDLNHDEYRLEHGALFLQNNPAPKSSK